MATKKQVPKPEPPAADLEDIPDFLKVENRVPLTKEQQEKLDAQKAKAVEAAYDPTKWGRPKGMSDEDYAAWTNRERLEKQGKMKERFTKLRKTRVPKAKQPTETFHLTRDWARENKLDARAVRIAARANKDRLKPLETFGKYVYPNSVKDQVAKIIYEGLKPVTKGKVTKTKKTRTKAVKKPVVRKRNSAARPKKKQ